MNKTEGEKIAIEFTEDLVGDIAPPSYPLYKFYRWNIISKWSSYIYLYEIEMYFENIQIPNTEILEITASEYYSSYVPDRAFDGSTSSYWYTRGNTPQWIAVEFNEPKAMDAFRWYTGTSSYKPEHFILQGSNDGIAWTDLYEEDSPKDNYWIDFGWGPTEGEQIALKLTGQQYKYINGPLLDMDYKIKKVERHPMETKGLLLTMETLSRFPTVEGMLKIEYDASVGSLAGRGGPVESFMKTFTPTGLAPEHNPGVIETISVAPTELEVRFIKIEYNERFTKDTLSVAPTELEVNLIYVGVVNP